MLAAELPQAGQLADRQKIPEFVPVVLELAAELLQLGPLEALQLHLDFPKFVEEFLDGGQDGAHLLLQVVLVVLELNDALLEVTAEDRLPPRVLVVTHGGLPSDLYEPVFYASQKAPSLVASERIPLRAPRETTIERSFRSLPMEKWFSGKIVHIYIKSNL